MCSAHRTNDIDAGKRRRTLGSVPDHLLTTSVIEGSQERALGLLPRASACTRPSRIPSSPDLWIDVPFGPTVCRVAQTPQQSDAPESAAVRAAVGLLHRRHGWTRLTITGFIACAFGEALSLNGASQGAPAPSWFAAIVIVLAAMTVAGIIAVVVCSARLRRTAPEVLAQATPIAARHKQGRRAHHFPPRHLVTWILCWVGLALFLFISVISVSAPVDGIAYLAGAGKMVTFDPIAHSTSCSFSGSAYICSSSTDGIMETGGAGVSATWPAVVPLGRPFPVRQPFWRWGLGESLINNDRIAVVAIVIGLLLEAAGVLVLITAFRLVRNWHRHRQQRQQVGVATALAA